MKDPNDGGIGGLRGLQVEKAGNDGEVVLNAVMNFFEEDFFFFERFEDELLRQLLIRYVANGRGNQCAFAGLDGTQADLDGELGSISAATVEFPTVPHGPDARALEIAVPIFRMLTDQSLRKQDFDGLSQQFLSLITEQFSVAEIIRMMTPV